MKRFMVMIGIIIVVLLLPSCSSPVTPVSPPTDTVINIAAITGVTPPILDATPVTTITETDQYSGTVTWSDSPAIFAASTTYTATITLTAKAGYTLTGVAADFFTVAGATSDSNPVNSGVVTAVFPVTGNPADIDVTFSDAVQVGGVSNSVNTTSITLTFSVDPTTLSASDITVTGATKGVLLGTGTSRSLAVSAITVADGATVSVAVASPSGYAISGSPKTAVVYKAPTAVTFSSAVQVGGVSNSVSTTSLTLTFSVDPTSLTAANITVTGATKGTLSGTGTTRSLAISAITVANGATVSVAVTSPSGYTITGSPQTAVVYKVFTITLGAIPGVTAPVTGTTPVTTITSTAQYTGTLSWSPTVPTTFWSGTTYTATITLTAKAGFTLTGVTADFFTVAGATSDTNPVNSGVVTVVFPATTANLVVVTDITGTAVGTLKAVQGGTFRALPETVTVSSFRMSQHEITGEQYASIMSVADPSSKASVTNNPVEQVTWYDAVEFCNKLSTIEGLTLVYTVSGRIPATGYPITSATISVDWSANGYRLPTEAEWEFAAQGGIDNTQGYQYAGSNDILDVAWYSLNSANTSHTVGTLAANQLELYDMSGNVREWCWDWYDDYLFYPPDDYRGPAASPWLKRVTRGGGWVDWAENCTIDARTNCTDPDVRISILGFRVVRP